jgi:hypothetical protein
LKFEPRAQQSGESRSASTAPRTRSRSSSCGHSKMFISSDLFEVTCKQLHYLQHFTALHLFPSHRHQPRTTH